MNKRGFTLIELLVVVGIMGLLGTASIGAYRSVVKGMEERGATENASQFIHAAFQRAMIDRLPTAVYFWNETVREATMDDNEIVVGKAVAVRRAGRISGKDGNYLYDEFADLDRTYTSDGDKSGIRGAGMYLYKLDNKSDGLQRSRVYDVVHKFDKSEYMLLDPVDGTAEDWGSLRMAQPSDGGNGKVRMYGFELQNADGVSWNVGDAYGFEFQTIELPKNYIFGSDYSKSVQDPVREAGRMMFGGGAGGYERRASNTTGKKTIDIYALRPDNSGNLSAKRIGATADPTEENDRP